MIAVLAKSFCARTLETVCESTFFYIFISRMEILCDCHTHLFLVKLPERVGSYLFTSSERESRRFVLGASDSVATAATVDIVNGVAAMNKKGKRF